MKSPIHRLGSYAHPKGGYSTSPKSANTAKPNPEQIGKMKAPLIGKKVPPANVSKPRTRPY